MEGKEEGRIFVGGLSWQTDERKLQDAFGRFGKVVDAQVPAPTRPSPLVLLPALGSFARSISSVLSRGTMLLGTVLGRAVGEVERRICRLLLRSVERGCVFCVGRRITISAHFYAFRCSGRGVT
jgi:heterogeneous nuclear ribonucleoprotein G